MNNRLIELLAEVFSLRKSEINVALKKDDIDSWDSLKQMDLVSSLENEFDIRMEIDDIQRMVSINDILIILKEKGISIED